VIAVPDWGRKKLWEDWPQDAVELPTAEVIELYRRGCAGARYSKEAVDEFKRVMMVPESGRAVSSSGMAGDGAGKLVVPFVFALELYPGCWPGPGQERGDCVSHGTKNASLLTMCCDIASGQIDEQSGKPEEAPVVSAEAIKNGVISSEAYYWQRGYNGDGWYCPAAAKVACQVSGLYLRQPYPDLGLDLTRYSGKTAGRWGSPPPPANVTAVGAQHLIHQATQVKSFEDLRDLLYNGYGILDCGQEGYSDRRDDWGASGRQGSWGHSMSELAVDDRPEAHGKYGGPLVLILNSWGKWNTGPRDIYGSAKLVPPDRKDAWIQKGIVSSSTGNILIPEGSFWSPWSQCKARERFALSGAHGWPKKVLPPLDWGAL
jgi:hypothetical protein